MSSRFTTSPNTGPATGTPAASSSAGADAASTGARASGPANAGTAPTVGEPAGATGPSRPPSRPDLGPPGAGVQAVKQPVYGLGMVVSLVVAAVVFVLAIYATGDADDSRLPLAQTTNALYWGVAALAVVGAGVGAQFAERTAAAAAAAVGRPRPETAMATAWTVPAIATAAAVLLVATYHNATMLVAGPLLAFLGNAGALLSRDLLDDAADSTQRTATTIHTLVIHAVAFLALSAIYLNKLPVPLAALAVGVVGGLLTLETLERGTATRQVRLLYAVLAGVVMAQAMIALDWWQTHGWTGGAVLLVCFYLASGVLLARTQRSIVRNRDLVEFGLVGLVAFAVLAFTA